MQIIKSEKQLCMCCMEEHEVKTVLVSANNIFKNVPIDYIEECFYCENVGETYMDEEQLGANDIRMKDAYRKAVGLLTSGEIVSIRSKYGISQSDLCTLLGWGGKTITRYESHQVQDRAHDSILKKISQDPEWLLKLLEASKDVLPCGAYKKYYETAGKLYAKAHDKYLRKSICALYAGIGDDAKKNGNASLSLDKVVDLIRYFSNSSSVKNLYKVKLMKLLWYADFLSYKNRNQAITGLVYRALPMGAVPVGHDQLIDLSGVEYEEIDMGDGTGYLFKATDDNDYPYLSSDEITIAEAVARKLGSMSTNDIVSFMHKEQAYMETPMREIISFQYARNLRI